MWARDCRYDEPDRVAFAERYGPRQGWLTSRFSRGRSRIAAAAVGCNAISTSPSRFLLLKRVDCSIDGVVEFGAGSLRLSRVGYNSAADTLGKH
jgi:hypothetical protein